MNDAASGGSSAGEMNENEAEGTDKTEGGKTGAGGEPQGAFEGYGRPDWPMSSYAVLVGLYASAFAGVLLTAKKTGRKLPERVTLGDIALMSVASHRLSRVLTKDYVTSPLRAPFTRYQGPGGPSETKEKARGDGMRQAIGELLTCPWCAGQWTASAFVYGLLFAPRVARLAATIFTVADISTFLNLAYTMAENKL